MKILLFFAFCRLPPFLLQLRRLTDRLASDEIKLRRERLRRILRDQNKTSFLPIFSNPMDLATLLARRVDWGPENIAYLYIPKAGSTFVRNTMKQQENQIMLKQRVSLSKHYSLPDQFTFTLVRDPLERLVSAYSTITSRYDGCFGKCRISALRSVRLDIPLPQESGNIADWKTHFIQWIDKVVDGVNQYGFENPKCRWNEHIIPQIEFLRGNDLQHVGCAENIETTFREINLHYNTSLRRNNYERSGSMPSDRFHSVSLLSHAVKERILTIYSEDYDLHNAFCSVN